jgi:anti-sigma factor RsiW
LPARCRRPHRRLDGRDRATPVELRHPVEVNVSQEANLVQWLSKRLGRPLVVPNLTAAGYQLIGGRLLPAEEETAAQFMYQNGKGERLTLYMWTGIGASYWSDRGFGYAIAARGAAICCCGSRKWFIARPRETAAAASPPGRPG